MGQQPLLVLLAPHHSGRGDHDHAADVVRITVLVEILGHRHCKGIANDGDGVDLLGVHRAPQLGRIELLGIVEHHHDPAAKPGDHRLKPARAVHERWTDEGAVAHAGLLHERAVGLLGIGCRADAATSETSENVGLAPHHALGHAGGAAGVDEQQIVGAQLDVRRGPIGLRGGFVGRRTWVSTRCRTRRFLQRRGRQRPGEGRGAPPRATERSPRAPPRSRCPSCRVGSAALRPGSGS